MKPYIMIILFLELMWMNIAYAHSSGLAYLTPMPMPTQYKNLDQYQQALKIWEMVNKKLVARNHQVQLPPMPMPTQYKNLDHYQQALKVWETVVMTQDEGSFYGLESPLTRMRAMPMPSQYKNLDQYHQALALWVKVHQRMIARQPNVQPSPMPMPTQYPSLDHYQEALQAWQEVFK